MPDTKYAHPETLVETDWLAEHAKDPNVRVFEVDVDTASYEQGHAAGAIGVNWRTDLQQQPVGSGEHLIRLLRVSNPGRDASGSAQCRMST